AEQGVAQRQGGAVVGADLFLERGRLGPLGRPQQWEALRAFRVVVIDVVGFLEVLGPLDELLLTLGHVTTVVGGVADVEAHLFFQRTRKEGARLLDQALTQFTGNAVAGDLQEADIPCGAAQLLCHRLSLGGIGGVQAGDIDKGNGRERGMRHGNLVKTVTWSSRRAAGRVVPEVAWWVWGNPCGPLTAISVPGSFSNTCQGVQALP